MSKKRQNYMHKADVLFSKLVRDRDRACQECGTVDNLQCAHLISRSYKSIRTNFDNAVALCRGCHTRYTHRPLEWREWVETRFPGRWDALTDVALRYERVDWKHRHAVLKELAESLGVS
jgi:5-methylcytosine-specific restriction endonuclease McrA